MKPSHKLTVDISATWLFLLEYFFLQYIFSTILLN